jgi:hypothetical protein
MLAMLKNGIKLFDLEATVTSEQWMTLLGQGILLMNDGLDLLLVQAGNDVKIKMPGDAQESGSSDTALNSNPRKFLVYSQHDTNVAAWKVYASLRKGAFHWPKFSGGHILTAPIDYSSHSSPLILKSGHFAKYTTKENSVRYPIPMVATKKSGIFFPEYYISFMVLQIIYILAWCPRHDAIQTHGLLLFVGRFISQWPSSLTVPRSAFKRKVCYHHTVRPWFVRSVILCCLHPNYAYLFFSISFMPRQNTSDAKTNVTIIPRYGRLLLHTGKVKSYLGARSCVGGPWQQHGTGPLVVGLDE